MAVFDIKNTESQLPAHLLRFQPRIHRITFVNQRVTEFPAHVAQFKLELQNEVLKPESRITNAAGGD